MKSSRSEWLTRLIFRQSKPQCCQTNVQWQAVICSLALSPNSDQQQFSPNNVHTLSRDKVMRINKMIVIEKISWSFIKFSQLILKGDVWRSVWRICMWIFGLKGLRPWVLVWLQGSNLNSSSTVKPSSNWLSLSCLAIPQFAFVTWLMCYSDTEIQTFDQSLIYL